MPITLAVDFVTETCCNCGVLFGMTKPYQEQLFDARGSRAFYCPNGHRQYYLGKSKDQQIADLKFEVQQKDNRLAEARAEKERLERRIKKGVCLYCKRTFPNIAAHMACKHKGK